MFHILIWYRQNLQKILIIWGPLLFAGGWVSAIILGFYGYYVGYQQIDESKQPFDILYTSMQLFLINYKLPISPPNMYLQIARFLSPTMMFLTAIFLLLNKFQECARELYIRTRKNHAIICGLGFLGPTIARKFIEQNIPVLAIEKDSSSSEIEKCRDVGAVVVSGDANDEAVLRRLKIANAAYCIITTGDDARNLGIGSKIGDLLKNRQGYSLNGYIHVADHHLERLLTSGQVSVKQPGVIFDFFSVYRKAGEEAVRMWLDLRQKDPDSGHSYILVVGVGRMGENLIIRLAREWCRIYRNYGIRLTVIMLDRKNGKKEHILAKFPWIDKYCTIKQITHDLKGGEFLSGSSLSEYQSRLSAIFICICDETTGMSAALSIKQNFDIGYRSSPQDNRSIPIFVRTERDDGVGEFPGKIGRHPESQVCIYPFPVLFRKHPLFTMIGGPREKVAQVIHDEYRSNHPEADEWAELSEDFKNSNRDLADTMGSALHACGYQITMMSDCLDSHRIGAEVLEDLAIHEHERFVSERIKSGWKYGPKKDPAKKIHDALVPWEDLKEKYKKETYAMVEKYPRYLEAAGLVAVK